MHHCSIQLHKHVLYSIGVHLLSDAESYAFVWLCCYNYLIRKIKVKRGWRTKIDYKMQQMTCILNFLYFSDMCMRNVSVWMYPLLCMLLGCSFLLS